MCPNEIAGVEAKQNRHQLHFAADNLDELASKAPEFGGSREEIVTDEAGERSLTVLDPDGNTIVFVQSDI